MARVDEVIAIIPARGGSKGVPGKNTKKVGGVPLVGRAIRSAEASNVIGTVYVSTDDQEIASVSSLYGATVIHRPDYLSSDLASSEDALLHALDSIITTTSTPDIIVFIQATSPFIDPENLHSAVAKVASGEHDVVFSAIPFHGFLWRESREGAQGINHSASVRLRRQDRPLEFLETGAFYVMRTSGFLKARHRFFGRVALEIVPEEFAIEIDTPSDLNLARRLAISTAATQGRIAAKALVMDFDGVHTDNRALIDTIGNEYALVSRSDGMGIEQLKRAGIPMLILSKERVPIATRRGEKLSIEVANAIDDKPQFLRNWCESNCINLSDVAYVGNDVNDVGCLEIVGWPIAVADAHLSALNAARIILQASGGYGAIREVADRMLEPGT